MYSQRICDRLFTTYGLRGGGHIPPRTPLCVYGLPSLRFGRRRSCRLYTIFIFPLSSLYDLWLNISCRTPRTTPPGRRSGSRRGGRSRAHSTGHKGPRNRGRGRTPTRGRTKVRLQCLIHLVYSPSLCTNNIVLNQCLVFPVSRMCRILYCSPPCRTDHHD